MRADFDATMIGVVVIGRNEGQRLHRCLGSLAGIGAPIIYVDSGSSDGSPDVATSFGARVVIVDPAEGFSAARARNAGFAELRRGAPRLRHVQFLDGDCTLLPGWIDAAVARLEEDPGLAVVAGRRHEMHPEASIFNRLCDMEWNTPIGPAAAVGGDALYRVEAFSGAGGFNPDLICGEEPELCLRLRRAGWRIERLDRDMTLHDAAMTHWSQWFKRCLRSGWAYAEGATMHGYGPERYKMRERRSTWIWGFCIPALLISGAIAVHILSESIYLTLIPLIALIIIYSGMISRIAAYRMNKFNDDIFRSALYATMTMLGKLPQWIGDLSFIARYQLGHKATLIEYKNRNHI